VDACTRLQTLYDQSRAHAALCGEQAELRARLDRVPSTDLDLRVIDRSMGDEARSVLSLSGGETFLVSLALALGLSSFSARAARVGTLFIDEGLGTLDPRTLEHALAALDALQSTGRQVVLSRTCRASHRPWAPRWPWSRRVGEEAGSRCAFNGQ
jgi:DNA repair exonuclease SbcCD ATPase subunit